MAISRVQNATAATSGYVQSSTVALSSNAAAGSVLLLFVATSAATANNITSVTDTRSNTWTKLRSDRLSGRTLDIWYTTTTAGAVTATVTSTDYITRAMVLTELSGVDTTTSFISANQSAVAFSSSSSVSTSITAVDGYPFYIAYATGDNSTLVYTGNNSIASVSTAMGGDFVSAALGSKNTTATGSILGGFDLSSAQAGGVGLIALKETSGVPQKSQVGTARIVRATTTRAQQLVAATASWFARYMRADGAIVRPSNEGNNDYPSYAASQDVVSEGQAYGLIFALQILNDQGLFDKLETWAYNNLDRRNYVAGAAGQNAPSDSYSLMAYHYNSASNAVYDWAAAYDADIDRAKALIWAHVKWGSGGTINYLARARAIIQDMDTYGLRLSSATGYLYLVSGTGNMSTSSPEMNNSYQDPAAFRLFAQYSNYTNSFTRWMSAVDGAYDIIQKTANAVLPNPVAPGNAQIVTAMLPANWVTINFSTGAVSPLATTYRDTNFTYDAFRQIHRLRYDKKFYNEARAEARLADIRMFYSNAWNLQMPNAIQAEYFHDGSVKANYEANIFYWTAVLDLAGDAMFTTLYNTIRNNKFINNTQYFNTSGVSPTDTFYDNSPANIDDVGYYSQSWLIFSEMDDQNTITNYGQSTVRNQIGNARIQYVTSQIQTGTSRITSVTSRTQTGTARITAATNRNQTGNARIRATLNRTITGNSRITATITRVQTGISRIQYVTSQNISGNTRIQAVVNRDQIGSAYLNSSLATTQKMQTGNANIRATTTRDQIGNARIQITTVQNIVGNARIVVTTTQNIIGNARITVTTNKDQVGNARILVTTSQNQAGNSRITQTVQRAITGTARILQTVIQTINGTSRITAVSSRDQTGNARILVNGVGTQPQVGNARIQIVTSQPQTGISRIVSTVLRTITGNARITATTSRSQIGNSRIEVSTARNQTGTARVSIVTTQNQNGTARIDSTLSRPQTGSAYIVPPFTSVQRMQTGNASIKATTQQLQIGNATVAVQVNRTITGNARVLSIVNRDQNGNAAILGLGVQPQIGRASLANLSTRPQIGTARIDPIRTPGKPRLVITKDKVVLKIGKEKTVIKIRQQSTRKPVLTIADVKNMR